jgi:uncharacterized protein YdaU (DUF1376 family)
MSAPPYMKLYIADYLADTTHLTRGEHGAYLLLLMAMWRSGGKLPKNDTKLAAIAQCSADEWTEIRATVLEFFKSTGGALRHKRVSRELSHYDDVVKKRKIASDSRKAKKDKSLDGPFDDHLTTKPEPEPELEPVVREEPTITDAGLPDWKVMLEEAKAAIGDAGDFTRPAMHHAADLRGLVEPHSGEPCTWPEVLTAIEMTAMRQRAKRKPIPSWAWVRDDAFSLRDKRLNASNPGVRATGPPRSFDEKSSAVWDEAIKRLSENV